MREETDGDVWMLFKGSQPPQNWTDDVKFEGPAHLKPRAGIPFEVAFRSVRLREIATHYSDNILPHLCHVKQECLYRR